MINGPIKKLRHQALEIIRKVQSSRRAKNNKWTWRKDFKWRVASLVLSTSKGKDDLLSQVKKELETAWPKFARDIHKIRPKDLLEKVQAVTYEFLKELKAHRKAHHETWDLDEEVPSAHEIFRYKDFNSELKTLHKWLNHKSRRPQLASIPIPSTGTCTHSSSPCSRSLFS